MKERRGRKGMLGQGLKEREGGRGGGVIKWLKAGKGRVGCMGLFIMF